MESVDLVGWSGGSVESVDLVSWPGGSVESRRSSQLAKRQGRWVGRVCLRLTTCFEELMKCWIRVSTVNFGGTFLAVLMKSYRVGRGIFIGRLVLCWWYLSPLVDPLSGTKSTK